ncbi:MAG: hypothetical protein ACWGPN_05595 [Gammaproteobacteria bacterium]
MNNKETAPFAPGRPIALLSVVLLGVVTALGSGGGGSDSPAPTTGGGGGGGGDDGGTGGGTTAVTGVSVEGGAAKGIVNMGDVVAEELDASGNVLREVGSATTDADTLSSNAQTELKCDIPAGCGTRSDGLADDDMSIDFGEWYVPGAGNLTLVALIPEAEADATVSAAVTPFTDLAARTALSGPSLDAAAIYSAYSEISQLLGGIDILNTRTLDITDPASVQDASATEIAYSALGAAIASFAEQTSGTPDWNALLETLEGSIVGGLIMADDTGSSVDDERLSVQEILDAAHSVFAVAGLGDTSGVLLEMQNSIDNAVDSDGDGFNDIDPQPSDTAGSPALTKVKTFVSDLRTWGNVVRDELGPSADAFAAEIGLASDAAGAAFQFLDEGAMRSALDVIVANFYGEVTSGNLVDYGVGFDSGSIVVSNGVYTIDAGVIDGVTVDLEASIPVEGEADTVTIGINSATFASSEFDAEIAAGTLTLEFESPYVVDYEAIELGTAEIPIANTFGVVIDISFTQKQDGLGNDLESAVTFGGAFSTTFFLTQDENGYVIWATPSILSFDGEIGSSLGNTVAGSFTLNIANAADFEPFDDPQLVLDGLGELEGPGEGEWLEATLGLDFSLQLAGLPEAMVNINIDRSSLEEATTTISISYGNRQIVIANTLFGNAHIEIVNQDGVVLDADVFEAESGLVEGSISFGDSVYGTIEELPNGLWRISYIDGSFEIF